MKGQREKGGRVRSPRRKRSMCFGKLMLKSGKRRFGRELSVRESTFSIGMTSTAALVLGSVNMISKSAKAKRSR